MQKRLLNCRLTWGKRAAPFSPESKPLSTRVLPIWFFSFFSHILYAQRELRCERERTSEHRLDPVRCRAPTFTSSVVGTIYAMLKAIRLVLIIWCGFRLVMMIRELIGLSWLAKHQNNLDDTKKEKPDGKINEPTGKTLQLGRRLGLLLSKDNLNLGHNRPLTHIRRVALRDVGHLCNQILKCFFGRRVHNAMPNSLLCRIPPSIFISAR